MYSDSGRQGQSISTTDLPSLEQFVVWIAIGLVGGSLAGMMVAREQKSVGLVRNLGLGLDAG